MRDIRRRYRGERYRTARRDEIVKKAVRIFAKKGYENTSMDDIAERAKVAKGTLYYYFPSKEDLYHQVMVRTLKDIFEEFARVAQEENCPFKAFTDLLQVTFDLFKARPELLNLFLPLLNGQDLPGQRRVEELVAELMAIHRGIFMQHFGKLLEVSTPERLEVLRFLGRATLTNMLVQLRKGNHDHVAAVLDDLGPALRDGFAKELSC